MAALDTTSSEADLGTAAFRGLPLPSARQGVVGVDSLGLADLRQATEYHEGRYHELAVDPEYPRWRDLLSIYVSRTAPHAVELQGAWTLSALPKLHRPRLYTLSVRGTETFFAPLDPMQFMLNVASSEGIGERLRALGVDDDDVWPMEYRINRRCPAMTVTCGTVASMARLLEDDAVLAAAYSINRALLLYGSTRLRAHHNGAFAADVLLRAWRGTRPSVIAADDP